MAKGGGNNQTTTTKTELAPQQQDILNMVMPVLKRTMQAGAVPYAGQRTAGFTPNELAGQNMVANLATGEGQSAANAALGGLNFLTSGDVLNPNTNPGLAGAIQAGTDPIRQEFLTSVMPQIRSNNIMSNTFGGSEQGELTNLAGEAMMRQIGNTTANIVNPAYQAGLDAMTRGIGLMPSTLQGAMTPGMALSGVGAQQREMQQARINDEMQKYLERRYGNLMLAKDIAGTAFGMPGATGITTASGQQGPGMGQQMMGGALSGAAMGGMTGNPYMMAGGAGLGLLMPLMGFMG